MSVPIQMDEGMQNVLVQLQQQYQTAARGVQASKAQLSARQRDHKLATLTLREIQALPKPVDGGAGDVNCYRGVGRMFVQESRADIEANLQSRMNECSTDVATLEKKIKRLEGEMNTAQGSIRDVIMEHRKNA